LNEVSDKLKTIKAENYLLVFPLLAATLFLTAWRSQLILRKIGIFLNFKESTLIFIAGLSMLITPVSSGAIIKSHLIKKKTGSSISSTAPIVIYEKWLEFVSVVIIIGIMLLWTDFLESKIIFIVGLVLASISFFIFKNVVGLKYINAILTKFGIFKNFIVNVDEFRSSTSALLKTWTMIELLSITVISKVISLVYLFFIFQSLDVQINFFEGGQIFYTSTLIGVISFLPGGLIVTEAGLLGMLLKKGIGTSTASLLVILVRLVTNWIPIILGFIALKFSFNQKND
jgi:uncharacterized protein (TIRG00374 family)